ncbi:MetQ/NlpA family ABC transporter substrate-binding protein [Legionella yabuuchiae]|uniref:MetQ/NlpA family ABC transporter substrate-binding protein n=1 Tax=Legionella yabuuchiae TaxID=376727 RepID=UPI0010549082|nr:MetQ/NlpA family ABC transporter substrate-binding protein [Legionella yabuuchiae]
MRFILVFILTLTLIACSKPSPNTIVVGTIAGPETELVEVGQKVAKEKYDLNVKIIEFSDYNLPNEALQDGSLDANIYQHQPYLEASKKAHGYELEAIGKTFIYPTAIYSKKFKTLDNIPVKATVAIPNDPSNESRALLLLQKAGLIRLSSNQNPDVKDIVANPKQLKFKELDAAQLPRVLDDVDLAVINTNFAIPAGLSPSRDGLLQESKDSPYANIIVIKSNSEKKPQLELFVKAMHSEEVKQKAKLLFGDGAIPAWE